MRFHGIVERARGAAADGALAGSKKLWPGVRALAREFAGAPGSIELASVLAGDDGKRTFRFRIVCPCGVEPEVGVWDAGAKRVPAEARRIAGFEEAGEGLCETIVSVSLDGGLRAFFVGGPAVGLTEVSASEIRKVERARDDAMVNPGIDARYRHALDDAGEGASAPDEGPLMSIVVPLYETPPAYFRAMADSVLAQTYGKWELVLVNASPYDMGLARELEKLSQKGDARIKTVELSENKGISENTLAGIAATTGDYISFLDHDDLLAPEALAEYAAAIADNPEIDLLYCDEDSITHDGKTCFEPRFKTDFNRDMLLSYNFVCHFLTVSRVAYEKVEPYTSDVDGAQDYDLTLKVAEVARAICHVPRVLYHWRQHEGSTNGGLTEAKPYVIESSLNALERHHARCGRAAEVAPTQWSCVFATKYPENTARDVSILVAYDSVQDLAEFAASLDGQRMGIVAEVVAAGPSLDTPEARELFGNDDISPIEILGELAGARFVHAPCEASASFAVKIDTAARMACGNYLLVSTSHVRFDPQSDCVGSLRDIFCREDVGVASAKAMSLDGHVLHAGLCVKDDGSLGYLNQGFVADMGGGYRGCAEIDCSYSAIDPACFMVSAFDFWRLGTFDPGFADAAATGADFSFKVRALGKSVVVRAQARISMQMDARQAELGRSYAAPGTSDHALLWQRHPGAFRRDVLANPNVDLSGSYFALKL